ncbi:pantothenate transporter liz1 [Colletotrichum spaethianum]|uniref:Pantothenate transporter liz1 n=1 Tax=Colletotrichum spaethianum TaxID=700344 RepID=A0AA37LER4_9PEZI|nr:pantothenate transporter liz1 [Colletotrichum spaethianum]GKT45089.1 pantothenate transporter liz1 [Colletotrichum spaethianum]
MDHSSNDDGKDAFSVVAQPNEQQPKRSLRKRIAAVVWDSLDKTPEERKFIAKIDWWILSYCCIAYFVKCTLFAVAVDFAPPKYGLTCDLSNAYVSGMKEDLHLSGNDLNYLTTFFNIGYIIGQLPSQLILTRIRPSIWLPTLELIWSFVVMGMAGAKNVQTMCALRFLVGLLEASAYPGIMTLLGIIGIPICLYGYWAIPDQPTSSRARWLKPEDRRMAIGRMESCGREPIRKLTWRTIKDIANGWPVWLFSAIFIAHVLGIRIYSYFNVWLKSTGLYTPEEVNLIPTAGYGTQVFFTLTYAWASDAIGLRWPLVIVACVIAMIGTVILSVYPEDNIPAMMAAWILTFLETGAGALIITWINEVCSHSAEHRAVIIGVVETAAFTFQAWVPLLVYNSGDAPKFPIGYEMATMFFGLEIFLTLVILWCSKKWPVRKID